MWRMSCATVVTLVLAAVTAWGQTSHGAGVVFGAPGVAVAGGESLGLFHAGGGGEFVWPSGFGVSGDVGYISAAAEFTSGVGILSPGVFYRFHQQSETRPFVRGGYTLLLREGSASLIHFGGGFDRTIGSVALRFEVRDHFFMLDPGYHLVEGMMGVVIGPRRRAPGR